MNGLASEGKYISAGLVNGLILFRPLLKVVVKPATLLVLAFPKYGNVTRFNCTINKIIDPGNLGEKNMTDN